MTDNKLWIGMLLVSLGLLLPEYIPIEYSITIFRWTSVFFGIWFVFEAISQILEYKNRLKTFDKNILLNANEKWDFLYQDVWVPFAFLFLIILFTVVYFKEDAFIVYFLGLVLGWSVFNKVILRNKLIIEEDRIIYSDKNIFSEIEFSEIRSVEFDDNIGEIKFYFFQKTLVENNLELDRQNILDADDESVYDYRKKIFLRRGIFLQDWNLIKGILNAKAEEFKFKLEFVEAVKTKY